MDAKQPLVDLLVTARDSERKWCMALADIESSITSEVRIESLKSSMLTPEVIEEGTTRRTTMRSEGFTLKGTAVSHPAVGRLMIRLKNTPSFSNSEYVGSTVKDTKNTGQFASHL